MNISYICLIPVACMAILVNSCPTEAADVDDLLQKAMETALLTECPDRLTGEGVGWHAAWYADRFMDAAERTGDLSYVEAGITYFEALLDQTWETPDGYRGWAGPYIYDKSRMGETHITDAILVNPMLRVAEFILHEAPEEMRAKYEANAYRYIKYAKKHIIEKWDTRKTWWTDGKYAGYFAWNRYLNEDKSAWVEAEEVHNSSLGLPFNKNLDLAITHLRLFRLTGNPANRERARLICDSFKSRLCLFKDSYTWNYWEPVYPGDVRSIDPPQMGHWVGTHPYRDYQAGELACVIEAYENGLTFTAEDIDRFVAANLMMWNGSFNEPDFVNSDYAVWKSVRKDYKEPEPSPHYGGPAGALWQAMVPFSETLARLGNRKADNLKKLRLPGVQVQELEFPYHSSQLFSMVFALPAVARQGESIIAGCKVRDHLNLQIQLRSRDGESLIKVIHEGEIEWESGGHGGLHFIEWKADCAPGEYRLRWISGKDYRDFPIEIRPGKS